MRAIDATLPRKNGVAYFNRLYLQVTEAVGKASAGTTFKDPAFLDRLDVVFAGLYFDAEETIVAGAAGPVAWRPLIGERSPAAAPIQFALAGMNAHINHDLALAVVKTCQELGVAGGDDSPQHADYERVNAILAKVETQVAAWFTSRGDRRPRGCRATAGGQCAGDVVDRRCPRAGVGPRQGALEPAGRAGTRTGFYNDVLARTTELSGRAILV